MSCERIGIALVASQVHERLDDEVVTGARTVRVRAWRAQNQCRRWERGMQRVTRTVPSKCPYTLGCIDINGAPLI